MLHYIYGQPGLLHRILTTTSPHNTPTSGTMLSVLTIRTIQQIKDSIGRPNISARPGSFEPNCSRSLQAAHYIDGAINIMELLRSELTADDLKGFENLYERLVHAFLHIITSSAHRPSTPCPQHIQ